MNVFATVKNRRFYRYFVLLAIVVLIFLLRQFMSLLLLTTIFSYLALNAGKRVSSFPVGLPLV